MTDSENPWVVAARAVALERATVAPGAEVLPATAARSGEGPVLRGRTVAVRLDDAEHAAWSAAAQADGRGRLGSWVRDEVNARVAGREAGPVDGGLGVELAPLRAELARVGNNLNQAVRAAHANGVDAGAAASIEHAAKQVYAAIGRLRAAIEGAGS